jgi:hypothetical protein
MAKNLVVMSFKYHDKMQFSILENQQLNKQKQTFVIFHTLFNFLRLFSCFTVFFPSQHIVLFNIVYLMQHKKIYER